MLELKGMQVDLFCPSGISAEHWLDFQNEGQVEAQVQPQETDPSSASILQLQIYNQMCAMIVLTLKFYIEKEPIAID